MPTTRKRPAPGTSPLTQREQIAKDNRLNSPEPASPNPLGWQYPNQRMAINSSADQNSSDLAHYQNTGQSISSSDPYMTSAAQQLARRAYNGNQNLVQTQNYGTPNNGQWAEQGAQVAAGDWPVQYDDLDQRAEVAKQESLAKRKQIPPFIQKLSSFLDESRNTELIRWSDSGDSFIVLDEDEFAKTLIPELFKHNNYASFVRQLNMYGFHKKVGLSDNSMRASERKNKNPSEYSNPYFKRGRPNLLWLIHKPKNPPGKATGRGRNKQEDFDEDVDETFGRDNSPMPSTQDQLDSGAGFRQQPLLTMGNMADRLPQNELSGLRQELREVQANQLAIREMLRQTRQEHQQLYGQAKAFHDLHEKHDNSINAILSFLATVYNKNLAAGQAGSGEMFPGAIPSKEQPRGNVVDMGDDSQQTPQPFRRPQLLLEARHPSPTSPASLKTSQRPSRLESNNNFFDKQAPSPNIQELSDNANTPSNRSSQSPQFRPADTSSSETNRRQIPEADILRMMNNASSGGGASGNPPTMRMDFPEALTHLQTADGQSPLTPNQRQNMLQLMGNDLSAAAPNTEINRQPLALPNTPPTTTTNNNSLSTFDWPTDQSQINQLERAIREQDANIANLNNNLAPLSPSGSIPGITHPSPGQDFSWAMNDDAFAGSDPGYFNDAALTFDSDFNNIDSTELPDFDFTTLSGGEGGKGAAVDADTAGAANTHPASGEAETETPLPTGGGEDDVETVESSEATSSPAAATSETANANANATGANDEIKEESPGKRRRVKK